MNHGIACAYRPDMVFCCRYEGRIVQQMIVKDGGKGTFKEATPGMLGIWGALIKVGTYRNGLSESPCPSIQQA